MNGQSHQHGNPWRELFAAAIAEEQLPPPHFVDDDDVLERWSIGKLPEEQARRLDEHLAGCAYCRDVLATFVREELVDLPPEFAPPPVAVVGDQGIRRRLQLVLTLAALLCVVVGLAGYENRRIERSLALAESEIGQGRGLEALGRMESLDRTWFWLAPQSRARAEGLAEQAGYEAARERLRGRDFASVPSISDRVAALGGRSPRLTNLRLQALREVPAEVTLDSTNRLMQYGFGFDGQPRFKASSVPDEAAFETTPFPGKQELQDAIRAFPGDPTLQLNYGQLLLKNHFDKAAMAVFNGILSRDSANLPARMGLGLAAFKAKQFDLALRQFQQVLAADEHHFAAHLNAAIAAERLNDRELAEKYWQAAERLAPDLEFRQQIREHRAAGPANDSR